MSDASDPYQRLLERLDRLAQAVGLAPDLRTVCRALLRYAEETAPCNGIFVSLYDAQSGLRTCIFAAGDGHEHDVSQLPPLSLNDSPNSRAILTGETIFTDDFPAATAGATVVDIGLDRDPRLPQSAMTMPLRVMGRVIGAFEVQSLQRAAFVAEDAHAMQMAANVCAIVIENIALLARERELREAAEASEKALLESDHSFRVLVESMPQLVWLASADGANVYSSRRWRDYTGLTLDEALGNGWQRALHPDDRDRVARAWSGATEHVADYEIECRLRRADGSYGWILNRGLPLRDASGRIHRWLGTATDIEEQKRVEQATRRQAAQQRLIAEFGKKALADGDPGTLCGAAAALIEQGLNVEFGAVFECRAGGRSLVLKAGGGWQEAWVGSIAADSIAETHYHHTLAHGELIFTARRSNLVRRRC